MDAQNKIVKHPVGVPNTRNSVNGGKFETQANSPRIMSNVTKNNGDLNNQNSSIRLLNRGDELMHGGATSPK